MTEFQSTRPRGARRAILKQVEDETFRFNPRARVGRDTIQLDVGTAQVLVSIHAPAWGATSLQSNSLVLSPVSIHAPAWGATCIRAT